MTAKLEALLRHDPETDTVTLDDAPSGHIQPGASGLAALMEAKMWQNPCWFAARFNWIALRYNAPLYGWIQQTYGLSRPEFVVIYSLGLLDGALARDISASSGFPKNTLSRAIAKLTELGLIERRVDASDKRNQTLHLLPAGRRMFENSMPHFKVFEERMLKSLDPAERNTLSRLLAKIVLDTPNWAREVPGAVPGAVPEGETPSAARWDG